MAWHHSWCISGKVNNDETDEPTTHEEDALRSARIFLKHEASTLYQNEQRLDRLLHCILTLVPPSSPSVDKTSDEWKQLSLKHIEWMVVLLLELIVRSGDSTDVVLQRFATIQSQQQHPRHKVKKRRRLTGLSLQQQPKTPMEFYLEFLIQQLTGVVFLLPSNEPLRSFLYQKCLTTYMWKRIPHVITSVFDYFEVENPYLPKEEPIFDFYSDHVKTTTLKKAKHHGDGNNKPKVTPQSTDPPPSRHRSLAHLKKKNHTKRINHFHGMMVDVERLLDTEPPVVMNKGKKRNVVACGIQPSAPTTVGSTITATRHQPVPMARTTDRGTIAPSLVPRRATTMDVPSSTTTALGVGSPPPLSSPIPARTQSSVVVAETPLRSARRDTTLSFDDCDMVSETPSSNRYHHNPECIIAETPLTAAPDNNHPGRLLSLHDDTPTQDDNDTVKPLKLFGAIRSKKAKAPLTRLGLALAVANNGTDDPKDLSTTTTTSSTTTRPTSVAVAAARSFLRRKSL
jgi:hypothetical protein